MEEVKISAVIITYNEERNIESCLESLVDVADEILVVDSHSQDRTRELAESCGARIVKHSFEGHIEQKNFAMLEAKYDHVLSLDADEALSIELIKGILAAKSDWNADAYRFNRLNHFCGKWIRHGLWYPDRKIRLWDRRKGEWGGQNPHDKVIMRQDATIKGVDGDLLHYTVHRIDEYIGQVNKFSTIQADILTRKGFQPNAYHLIIKPIYKFVLAYFIRLGFLDGWRGYMIAKGQALGIYLRYAKVRRNKPT